MICVAAFCIWGQQAVFWTLPSAYLRGASAAAGIALVNTGAAVGGFVAPPTIGFIRQATGSFSLAVAAIAFTSLVVAFIVGIMKIPRQRPEDGLTPPTPAEGAWRFRARARPRPFLAQNGHAALFGAFD